MEWLIPSHLKKLGRAHPARGRLRDGECSVSYGSAADMLPGIDRPKARLEDIAEEHLGSKAPRSCEYVVAAWTVGGWEQLLSTSSTSSRAKRSRCFAPPSTPFPTSSRLTSTRCSMSWRCFVSSLNSDLCSCRGTCRSHGPCRTQASSSLGQSRRSFCDPLRFLKRLLLHSSNIVTQLLYEALDESTSRFHLKIS